MESVTYRKTSSKQKDYWVGDNGEIISISKYKNAQNTCIIIKKSLNGGGYESANCIINGKPEKMVHRAVYRLHVGEIPENKQIDHIDRDRANNNLKNLRLVSAYENQKNKQDSTGENHPHSVLYNEQAIKICELYGCGATQEGIAKMFNVSRKTVSNIVRGLSYASATSEAREKIKLRRNTSRTHTQLDIDLAKKMIKNGCSRDLIAQKLGFNKNSIYSIIKRCEALPS
jgi:transposase